MKELSKVDTNILKGIALLFLLIHHLFYIDNGLYNDWYICNYGIVNELGKVCKVCVPLFVFLSGYGLGKSTKKDIGWVSFLRHRLAKLMPTYWLIWVLFVPLGVFLFDRTFEIAYVDLILPKFLLDFFGLLNIFGAYGYNATWWFMSCIIMLYVLTPLILSLIKKNTYIPLFIISLGIALFHIPFLVPIRFYLLTFVIGIIFAKEKILSILSKKIKYPYCVWSVILIISIAIRCFLPYKLITDTFVCLAIILLYNSISYRDNYMCNFFCVLGKHSMNIFLFHTFIFAYYFESFIYSSRNPIIICLLLLGICLAISVLIEKIKDIIGFSQLQKKLHGRQ